MELLPKDKAQPVSFEGARISGALNESDRWELKVLIGRIPYFLGKVKTVTTCWDDCVVAAKIVRGRRCIYCTKSPVGQWEIVRMDVFFED